MVRGMVWQISKCYTHITLDDIRNRGGENQMRKKVENRIYGWSAEAFEEEIILVA